MDRKIVEQLVLEKSFNQICKALNVGKRRVRKVYDQAVIYGYLSGVAMPPFPRPVFKYKDLPTGSNSPYEAVLLEQKDWINSKLNIGWKTITIFEELPIDKNQVNMEISSFYRFINRHDLREQTNKRVVPEILHEPGEVLQLDWGKLRDVVDPVTGKKKTLWALVGVMGFSRYMMVELVWDNKVETTLNAITKMFSIMGGVPKKIVSDNPKCFSLTASKYEAILNPAFERFCSYYGVIPEILPPREPKKKGKVERLMPYVRRLYEAHGSDWHGLNESQEFIDKKLVLANERTHGTTKLRPIDVFLQHEAQALKALTATAYEVEEYHQGKVRNDGHVRFRNKYYSVDEKYHGQEVFIIGNSTRVEIYYRCELIETHARLSTSYVAKSTKEHHLKPWEQVAKDSRMYIDKAEKIGPNAKHLITNILMAGNGFVDTRKVWGILSLDKDYEKEVIDKACKYALDIGSLSYQTVKAYINLSPQKKIILKTSTNNKFTRSAGEYKQIIQ